MFSHDAKTMTFRVYQYDPAGNKHDSNREFSITLEESNAYLGKAFSSAKNMIDTYGVLMAMFDKVYGFTLQSGYNLTWLKTMVEGDIGWRNLDWHIKRIG